LPTPAAPTTIAGMTVDLIAHYGQESESTRLTRSPHGRLEYLRTQELLRAALHRSAARILDVGGATGIHAEWLAADGHRVHVIDVVPAHVATSAALPGVTAELGDARTLPCLDASVGAVLLLGPLYHLREAADRQQALRSARRVLRPGGVLAVAAISRYLGVLEAGTTSVDPPTDSLRTVIDTGHYDGHLGFVPAHFHTAAELQAEVESAGFTDVTVYGVEGPSWPALDVAGIAEFDTRRDAALRCARLVERDPLLINASAHLLAITHRQP
jgi:ubiquinone/menaquinone biosynthesis C-methylase UbiE